MKVDKKQLIDSLMDTIYGISNKNYQLRIWIKGLGPEVDDFDETCNWFFDLCDPMLEDYKDYSLSEQQYVILKDFRDKFEAFSDDNSWPPLFIDTPEWAQIIQQAKEVLNAFNYKKSS